MRDPLTVSVWPWVLIGTFIAAVFLGIACWYEDRYLPRIRQQLADDVQRLRDDQAVTLVASRLDAIDSRAMGEQEFLESEFVADIEDWLAARSRFEQESS